MLVGGCKLSKHAGNPFDDPSLYRSIVSAPQYLTITQPEVIFAVNKVCQSMATHFETDWSIVKRILHYLKGTSHIGFLIQPLLKCFMSLTAFSGANWVLDLDNRYSTSGLLVLPSRWSIVASQVQYLSFFDFKHYSLNLLFLLPHLQSSMITKASTMGLTLQKENDLLKKKNENLKEEQTKDLSKVNTFEMNEQLQKERAFKGPSKPSRIGRRHLSYYLDNGYSHHMKGERSMFQDLRPKIGGWVTFGGKKVGVKRIGKYHSPSIDNVLYVEGLKHMSISKLCDNGYDISFNKGECIVKSQNGSIIFYTKRQNNLHKINLTDLINENVTSLVSINMTNELGIRNLDMQA
ncbi:putative mitochondrial protein, partial [Mucuna pruriens]